MEIAALIATFAECAGPAVSAFASRVDSDPDATGAPDPNYSLDGLACPELFVLSQSNIDEQTMPP
jgi:hypothetical protein